MTQTIINLVNEPNISVSANITDANGDVHSVDINLRTMPDKSLIMDLIIDDVVQFYGRRCVNRMPLMLSQFIGGNFYFYDQYGNSDPEYTGFNDRYVLVYDTEFKLV